MLEITPEINNEISDMENAMLEALLKSGMQVIEPDIEAFKESTAEVIQEYECIWGEGLYEKIQKENE